MTVENTNSKSGPYDLDGSTLRFPRDFFLERPEHLQVFQVIDGVATLLTTGFTVTGIGSDEGEVIFSAEGYPVGGGVLMLKRNVPNTQETDYSNQARVKPEQVEIDLDKIVRQIQDLREVVNRSLHISIDQDLSDADLDRMSRAVITLGEIRDELEALYGKIPELQAVYDDLDEVTLAGRNIEAIKAFSGSVLSLVDKSFVATGGQTAFQLDVMAFAPENVIVWLNKVRLVPDLDYTTDGSTLILSAGASAGDVVDTLTISAVSMEDVKRIRDEALDAANKIKEAAVMQQTTFLIEEGKRIYQLYKDGRPVSVWEYGVRLFIAPYGPLVERQDYHILPDGRIELHHDFDPGSLGIADFMIRYTDSEIQQIILGTKENADRAEAAAADTVNNAPWNVKDYPTFAALSSPVIGARYRMPGAAWDVEAPSATNYDFIHPSGEKVSVYPEGKSLLLSSFGADNSSTPSDSTDAFKRALEAQYEKNAELVIDGRFRIDGSVELPPIVTLRGLNERPHAYLSAQDSYRKSEIRTLHEDPFTASESNGQVRASIRNIAFTNQIARGSRPPVDDARLFSGISFRHSVINGNLMYGYGTTIYGSMWRTSQFNENEVLQSRYCTFNGPAGFSFVDSEIRANYLNGDPQANSQLVLFDELAMSIFASNYVDFYKRIMEVVKNSNPFVVTQNRFDYSFRVLEASNLDGRCHHMAWIGNIHREIRKSGALSYFTNADTEMTDGDWIAINATGIHDFSHVGNVYDRVDTAVKNHGRNNYSWESHGNIYRTVGAKLNYLWGRTASEADQKDINVQEMNDIRVTTLPSASLTGSVINKTSCDKQRVIFNGKPVWNDNGVWRDTDGFIVAAKSGTTAERPVTASDGFQYFDTTLGKPIWRNGAAWVDATGTAV